jgi:hypothetical protein
MFEIAKTEMQDAEIRDSVQSTREENTTWLQKT